jgi:hypothetical protein
MGIKPRRLLNLRAWALTQRRAARKVLAATFPMRRIKIKINRGFWANLDPFGRRAATFWPYQFLKLSLSTETGQPQAFVT